MLFGEIGALLPGLAAAALFGNLWFHGVEAVLRRIKPLVFRRRNPPVWRPLPPDEEERHV